MSTAVIAALIAGIVTAAGWFANYALTSAAERKRVRITAQLARVEKQLEELYGPLYFLILEGRATFEDLLQTLGRRFVFGAGGDISEDELTLWRFWVDHDFMPRNAQIQSLLSAKTHLIAGDRLPASYIAFLDHYNSWRVNHARWQEEGVDYSWHSKINWPTQFEIDVIRAFESLKLEHARLIGMSTTPRRFLRRSLPPDPGTTARDREP